MKYGTITISEDDGTILTKNKVRFWNASRDETEPGLCITISGAELKKLLDVQLGYQKDPLLQIILPIDDVSEVISK